MSLNMTAASVGDTGGGMDGITSGVSDLHIRRDSASSGSSGDHYRGGRTRFLILRARFLFVSV